MQPIISISDLYKVYATGHHALKNVNLDIMHGEILALLGPNGAGKTTRLFLREGVIEPGLDSRQPNSFFVFNLMKRFTVNEIVVKREWEGPV